MDTRLDCIKELIYFYGMVGQVFFVMVSLKKCFVSDMSERCCCTYCICSEHFDIRYSF